MITKIVEILKDPMRLIDKQRQISERVDEMKAIQNILRYGNDMQISGGLYLLVKPTDEFEKTIIKYLNDRLTELAKEVQILQGVTPIEYKESEEK